MAKIYLARHGETEWNRDGRYQGALDSQLTVRGIVQVQRIGTLLARYAQDVTAAHVSPLGRARQSYAVITSRLNPIPTQYDPRLREVSLGSWDGLSRKEIDAEWPDALDGSTRFDWYFRSPDGESHYEALTRVGDWLADVEGIVLAVTHGLIGRLIRGVYLGLPHHEALSLPVPQDVVWVLENGSVSALDSR